MQLNQYLARLVDFNKAINLNPRNASLYYRHLSHSVLSQYGEAIEDYKKLVFLEPEDESHKESIKSLEEILKFNKRFNKLNE